MRVAFLLHGFPPQDVGGVELYVRALLDELGELGVDCVFLAGSTGPVTRAALSTSFEGGIPVTRLHAPSRRPENRALDWDPEADALIRHFLLQTRPDVVHVHHWLRLGPTLVATSAALGIPAVVTLADQWAVCPRIHRLRPNLVACAAPYTERLCLDCVDRDPWQGDDEILGALALRYRLVRRELALAARLLVPTESEARFLSAVSGLPLDRFEILPPGWLHRRPFGAPATTAANGRLRVGHWGHLHPYKGSHLLLQAARLPAVPPLEIHLWGEPVSPAYSEYLSVLAEGLRVTFHGRYRPEDLEGAQVDVAAFPSLCHEVYSFVLDEALALGLPVIVPDRGALGERAGPNAVLFRFGSVTDLARALREVADSPARLETLRAAASPPGALAAHAWALVEVYRSVTAEKGVAVMPGPGESDHLAHLRAQLDDRDRHLETLLRHEEALRQREAELSEANARLTAELAEARASLARLEQAETLLNEILRSKAWRLITVLRRIKAALPPWR